MKRRDFIGLWALAIVLLPMKLMAAVWNKAAFSARNIEEAEKGLAISHEAESQAIEVIAPSRAENGAIVQVEVNSKLPETEAIAIFVEHNPTALIGNYLFKNGALPSMVTRIKMAETSAIKIIAKSEEKYYTTSKSVQVMENGCAGTSSADESFVSSMKIRAKLSADKPELTQIKAIITHPMHTGQGKDLDGKLIPAHFIQLVTVQHNGKLVVDMQLGTGIARNPYFTFYLSGARLDDKVRIEWFDNLGYTDSKETLVIA